MPVIEIQNLTKVFSVLKKEKGLRGALNGLLFPRKTLVTAIDNISFQIEAGEIVGYIGPNGAGKSTTIKIMTGILYPTSGIVYINGLSPQAQRKAVVKNIGVVFGQRSQLYWDLRLGETFELLKRIYRIDDSTYTKNMRTMSEVLGVDELLNTPVRQLSLGQRMRGELTAAMLHSPSVIFLDEPTIGLDIEAKHSMRRFIRDINQEKKVTFILTTHDLDDVEQLCQRLIVINNGVIVEDGSLSSIIQHLAPYRILIVDFQECPTNLTHPIAKLIKQEGHRCWFQFKQSQTTIVNLINDLSRISVIRDVSIKEPDIAEVVKHVYGLRPTNHDGK